MWGRAAIVLCAGCATEGALAVEPASIDLDVDLAVAPPRTSLRVRSDHADVTNVAAFQLAGAQLGIFDGPTFISDGRTGGAATITVTVDDRSIDVPVTATVHGRRDVVGTPDGTAEGFAVAADLAVEIAFEPAAGEVLPPNLGGLDVDFAAADSDDSHEIAVTAPYLDIRVYSAGVAGPRHVALTIDEWTAIARTSHDVNLAVRSMQRGGAQAHRTDAALAIADIAIPPLLFSGSHVDATGAPTDLPALYRYDPLLARAEPFVAAPAGGCIGCHVAISPDGTRIAAAGGAMSGSPLQGAIIDVRTRAVTFVDPASPWSTSVFDPSGALVTSAQAQGTLVLRDGTTGVEKATLPIGEFGAAPAISPDGGTLAYVIIDPATQSFVGTALHLRPWNVGTASVGAVTELVTAPGVMAPQFSPDGGWIVYSRTASAATAATVATEAVRVTGGAPIDLTTGAGDGIPRWATPIATSGGEPMAWIAVSSGRPLGSLALVGKQQSVWLMAFYPERGVVSRPFHLPGQNLGLSSLHAPAPLP